MDRNKIKKCIELLDQRNNEIKNVKDPNSEEAQKRAIRIDKTFKDNVEKHIIPFECDAKRAEDRLDVKKFCIENFKKTLVELVNEIDALLASNESKKEKESNHISLLQRSVEEKKKSLKDSEQELFKLTSEARISREKANSLRKEMGYTVQSFISYLERQRKINVI